MDQKFTNNNQDEKESQITHRLTEEAKEIIHLIVDCEACEEQMAHFKEFLSECPTCMEYLNNHKNLIEIVKEKVGRKCCPEKIANSIKESIKENIS